MSNRCRRRRGSRPGPGPHRSRGDRVRLAAAVAAAVLLGPVQGMAAAPDIRFNIPAQPLPDALVAFGLQAGVSIGASDVGQCGSVSRAVVGRFTPTGALDRLLADTQCEFRMVDDRAFSVGPRRRVATPNQQVSSEAPQVLADPSIMLLDLTVTTTRRPSLVSLTPASVSVTSGPALFAGRIESLQDLAPEFAGVTVTNLGPGRNKVLVRGLSDGAFTGRTQSTVGLHLDDVPITYNAPDPDLRLIDLERVELMRGPQGSLYGVGSMGGIVRLVTRKPNLTTFEAGMAGGVASTQSGAASYSVDAMLNIPVVPDRLALRAVAYQEVAGGYVDDVALGIEDANRTTRIGGRLALTGQIAPDWRLTLGATHQALRSKDSQYTVGAVGRLQRDIRVREPHHNNFTQGYLTLDGWTGLGQFRLSGAYLVHDFDTRYDASSGLNVFSEISNIRTFDQTDRVRLAVAEATLSSYPGSRVQWLAGLFASRTWETLRLDHRSVEPELRFPLYFEDRKDRIGEAAAYGEVSFAIADNLSLTGGARAFVSELRTDSLRNLSEILLPFTGEQSGKGISPKAVLSWQPSPSKLFYAQVAQGYRTGGFNTAGRVGQQFSAQMTGNQPNRRYRSDRLWSYELGAKTSFADRRVELRTALFYTDWRRIQSDQFLPSGLPYTANVGRGVNTGFEGEAAVRVDSALTLRLSFLANAPELRERDPTYPARDDASLPAVPRYSASLVADWRRQIRPGLTAVLYGRVAYVGASILTFQEQASSTMGNYITARLAAGLEAGPWRLTAFVENPANTEGDTFAFGDPFTQGRVGQSTPLRPRTFGLSLARGL